MLKRLLKMLAQSGTEDRELFLYKDGYLNYATASLYQMNKKEYGRHVYTFTPFRSINVEIHLNEDAFGGEYTNLDYSFQMYYKSVLKGQIISYILPKLSSE